MQPLEVTFYTDGTGVVWDLHEPHHLDALLAYHVRELGRERGRGRGRIVRYEVNPVASDWSMVRAGRAMRYLPQQGGQRVARCRPPYWHQHDRCAVTSVGEEMECSRV